MLKKLLKQPLLQFFAIGAGLFAVFGLTNDTPAVPDRPVIEVSVQDAQWLSSQFEATWRRAPTASELSGLMDEYVREEVYVREALSLGLDQGDQIVRRRLRQKMEFLTESGAEAASLDDATLRAFYDANADTYRTAALAGFSQILLPESDAKTVAEIRAQLAAGEDFATLGVRTLLPGQVPLSPPGAVDGVFGQGVFERISGLEQGIWNGPIQSGYGAHLVRLDAFQPGAVPPFETVRYRVELEWRATRAQELRVERYDLLEQQYVITRPDPSAVLSQ